MSSSQRTPSVCPYNLSHKIDNSSYLGRTKSVRIVSNQISLNSSKILDNNNNLYNSSLDNSSNSLDKSWDRLCLDNVDNNCLCRESWWKRESEHREGVMEWSLLLLCVGKVTI